MTAAAQAPQIVVGLDVWYVDVVTRLIRRVDHTNGTLLASFPVPVDVVTPAGLAVTGNPGGPRALWLLDSETDQIWRLNASDGTLFDIIPAPSTESVGIGSACVVPGNTEEVFVVANEPGGLCYWIRPDSGEVIYVAGLGLTNIRDAAAFPLGSYGTGVCVLSDIEPGGCQVTCFNKLTGRPVMTHTYPWEGWGLGNRTVGTTDGTATELYASDLAANVLHVLRSVDGAELRTIPTLAPGADIRGVGGDCMVPPPNSNQDLWLQSSSFQTNFAGAIFVGAPSLDPGPCVYFDLDVTAGLTIHRIGLNFLNDGITRSGITVPNLIGTTASVQAWIVDVSNGLNGGSVVANLPRTYTINPFVPPAAPWSATGPAATGTIALADAGAPSFTTNLTPLHLNPGTYGFCLVMVPSGTSTSPPSTATSSTSLHPLISTGGAPTSDQAMTLTPRGLRPQAFLTPIGTSLQPNLMLDYILDTGSAYSLAHGSGCYDYGAPALASVGRPRHGALLQLASSNLDPSIMAVMTFLSPTSVPAGLDLGALGMPGCNLHILGPWLAEGLDLTLGAPDFVTTFGVIPPIGPFDVHAQAAALSIAAPPFNTLNVLLSQAVSLRIAAN